MCIIYCSFDLNANFSKQSLRSKEMSYDITINGDTFVKSKIEKFEKSKVPLSEKRIILHNNLLDLFLVKMIILG